MAFYHMLDETGPSGFAHFSRTSSDKDLIQLHLEIAVVPLEAYKAYV